MRYILILGVILFLMYIIKFIFRDKTEDYLYRRDMSPEKGELDFGWDLDDLVKSAINESKMQGVSEITALKLLRDRLLTDIPNIKKKYKIDERRIRNNIYYFLEQEIDNLKLHHNE